MDPSFVILTCWMSGAAFPLSFNLDFQEKLGTAAAPLSSSSYFKLDKAEWTLTPEKIAGPVGALGTSGPDKRDYRLSVDLKTNKFTMIGESPTVPRVVQAGTCEVHTG